MLQRLRLALSAALAVSLFSTLSPLAPSAHAADCSVIYGTVSGTTRYAKFTNGTACTWSVPAGVTSVQYLVVGGGGGGGGAASTTVNGNLGGGGGGAGGIVSASTLSVSPAGVMTLTIGTGGSAGAAGSAGGNGGASSLAYSSTTVTSNGGGGGAGSPGSGNQDTLSGDGGSNTSFTGGLNVWDGGGGGAGAGGNGTAGTDIGGQGGNGGAGGVGVASTLLGTTNYYGGGGGGGGTPSTNSGETDGTGAAGGSGVGGTGGGTVGGVAGTLATAGAGNTGSGGGGGGWRSGYADVNRRGAMGADGVIIIVFTKTAGSVSSISITSNSGADNTYKIADVITVTVVTSEAVTVTGSPRIPISGLNTKYFTYSSGTGTSSLTFTYTVVTSDSASAGVGVALNTLELNSGTILDTAGLAVTITHSAVAQSLSQKVDGILPTVSYTATTNIAENQSTSIVLTLSESGTVNLSGSWDRSQFTWDANTKTLFFAAHDYENPVDYDVNNQYYISFTIVDAAGNAGSGTYNLFVNVTNVIESVAVGTPTLGAQAIKGVPVILTVTSDTAGKADFYWNGKRIAGCIGRTTTGTSPNFTATCNWKPTSTMPAKIYVTVKPTAGTSTTASSQALAVIPAVRGTTR